MNLLRAQIILFWNEVGATNCDKGFWRNFCIFEAKITISSSKRMHFLEKQLSKYVFDWIVLISNGFFSFDRIINFTFLLQFSVSIYLIHPPKIRLVSTMSKQIIVVAFTCTHLAQGYFFPKNQTLHNGFLITVTLR